MGESMQVNWIRRVAEYVDVGSLVAELETGSFTVALKAPVSGYLAAILVTDNILASDGTVGILVENEKDVSEFSQHV